MVRCGSADYAISVSGGLRRIEAPKPVEERACSPPFSPILAQAVLGEILALYNEVNVSVAADEPRLPSDCHFRPNTLDNFASDAPVSQWSRGFVKGLSWLEDDWAECVPEEADQDFGLMMLTLSFFASRDLANACMKEIRRTDLDTVAATIRESHPSALADFARVARLIQQAVSSHDGPEPPRASVKVGRNDPCPCGSGRKYKKCCGQAQ